MSPPVKVNSASVAGGFPYKKSVNITPTSKNIREKALKRTANGHKFDSTSKT